MPKQLECAHSAVGAEVRTADKDAVFAETDGFMLILHCRGSFMSDFTISNAKTTRKYATILKHIRCANKCAFDARNA
jgi:hypothetical protein